MGNSPFHMTHARVSSLELVNDADVDITIPRSQNLQSISKSPDLNKYTTPYFRKP